jgi:phosphoribosylformimino-5-aminoimidazole carboxamide ribotide isomerase
MILIPAVDVLDHKVVQLVGGVPGSQQIVLPDPLETALEWTYRDAPYLHLVDLDGAFGKGSNIDTFKKIARECDVPVEVGGGIRTEATIKELISAGVDRVIIGTKAVKEPEWLADMAYKFPNKIILGLDTKANKIAIKGWQESSDLSLEKMFEFIKDLPLAAVLNTNVDVEGQKKGINEKQAREFISRCPCNVIASGGVTSENDARILNNAGAEAAIVGIAIYTNLLRPWEWETPWQI